jgi:hypothetical protein
VRVVRATGDLLSVVRDHCLRYHYLNQWPDPRSLPFAYALEMDGALLAPDGRLNGLIVMKKPQHHQHWNLFGWPGLPTAWQVLDLARVWINPWLQRREAGHSLCIFSQMVSRVLRRVQWDWLEHHPPRYPEQPYHIELIISYCERNHHTGLAYRASGFRQHGYSRDGTKEVYIRRLKKPLKRWTPAVHSTIQLPLFDGMPLKYMEQA